MSIKKLNYLKRWQFWVMMVPVALFFLLKFCITIPPMVAGLIIDTLCFVFDYMLKLLGHESIDRNMRLLIKWGFGK